MSEQSPYVSVGMPVYNGEVFIEEAIESILAQTYTDFELIITDNQSTDRTQEICEAYAATDSRIRYVRNVENLGAARNYNLAFSLARGKYFKWAAHDDVCKPEFLERCVQVLDADPDVVLASPKALIIDEEGHVFDQYDQQLVFTEDEPVKRLRTFFSGDGFHPIFGLIRADVLRKTGLIGKFEMADRVLLGELVLHGKMVEVPEYLFLRRKHGLISHRANPTDRSLAEWFDPTNRNKLLLPRWQRFLEYLKSIRRARLGGWQSLRCYLFMMRFMFVPRKWRRIASDIVKAAASVPQLLSSRNSSKVG